MTNNLPTVLITRPKEFSEPLAQDLKALGFTPVTEPLLDIEPVAISDIPNIVNYDGIIFTSVPAVRAFAEQCDDRVLPVYVVGKATKDIAISFGFDVMLSALDVLSLSDALKLVVKAKETKLLYVSGTDITPNDISDDLNIILDRCIVYKAKALKELTSNLHLCCKNKTLDYGLFFSTRTADVFIDLLLNAGLIKNCQNMMILCMSNRVACAFFEKGFKKVYVSERPTKQSLCNLLVEKEKCKN